MHVRSRRARSSTAPDQRWRTEPAKPEEGGERRGRAARHPSRPGGAHDSRAQGRKFHPGVRDREHVGHKLGEFAPTRTVPRPHRRQEKPSPAPPCPGPRRAPGAAPPPAPAGRPEVRNETWKPSIPPIPRITPRKVRVVADLIAARTSNAALAQLAYVEKRARAAGQAAAERGGQRRAVAKDQSLDVDRLLVSEVMVDQGLAAPLHARAMARVQDPEEDQPHS